MQYWNNYKEHVPDIQGKRKRFDNTIYAFDIETTSILLLNGKIIPAIDYQKLSKEEQDECEFRSFMYVWQFSINDTVYYGRTWEEFKRFLIKLDENVKEPKIIFVHNLAFEFQYFKSYFNIESVHARKSRKIMSCKLKDFNITFKCTLMMSNSSLANLPKLFKLPVEKMIGDLDYTLIRNSKTTLSEQELKYCEYDCLVVYHYIKRELETYEFITKIPNTSTGKVRRELQEITLKDFKYKRLVRQATNNDPIIYNRLQEAFMGGYTHANWIYADTILNDVDSWDFTSSYPYCLTSFKYPSSEFRRCFVKRREDMRENICYLLVVKFKNLRCNYYNNFISASKCRNIKGAKYDNGRIILAEELEMTITDIDFYFYLDSYKCEYEILECYYAGYNYLPKTFIEFVLQKYVNKTQFKGIPEKELEYTKEKNKFNSLYGMAVTQNIRDEVVFDDDLKEWKETPITNQDIIDRLNEEKKKGFLSFAYGVWCTAYARNNLLRNVLKLDDYCVYCDTDSLKLVQGYDKKVIDDYNKSVKERIKYVSDMLDIDINKYAPTDVKGVKHLLGVFDDDGHYDEFITQGAKKYAVKIGDKIKITVAGVPKAGANALKKLEDFKDDLVFKYEDTNKNLLIYCEEQTPIEVEDFQGNIEIVSDKSGCCLVPTTYVLGKAFDYCELIGSDYSPIAVYDENIGGD